MFRNYLLTAWRSFGRQRVSTFINILGLAVGLAASGLILLYLTDELTFDQVHPQAEDLYILGHTHSFEDGESVDHPGAPIIWGEELVAQYPEVEATAHTLWIGYPFTLNDLESDKALLTEELFFVSESLTDLLYYRSTTGDKRQALSQPNSLALSETAAKNLFGDKDPIGQRIRLTHPWLQGEGMEALVTDVYEDYPANVHFRPKYLVNMEIMRSAFPWYEEFLANWGGFGTKTYLRLAPGTDPAVVENALAQLLPTHLAEEARFYDPVVQQVPRIHFDSTFPWVNEGAGDANYLYLFSIIAVLIILVACINYMNLSTARAARRAKEVGLRKTLGGMRNQLAWQFMGESILTTLLAFVLSLGLMGLMLPLFNQVASKSFVFGDFFSPLMLGSMMGIVILVSLLAGTYPALYLSHFKPIDVLRGRFSSDRRTAGFRKVLVVFQFSVSLVLIICTTFILQQMQYIQESKLNQQAEQVVSIRFGGTGSYDRYQTFANEIGQIPQVSSVAIGNHLPRLPYFGPIERSFRFPTLDGAEYGWNILNVAHTFPQLFELDLVAGTLFDEQDQQQFNRYLINEAAVETLGKSAEEVVGLQLSEVLEDTTLAGEVLGVVADFPYRSMHSLIEPLVLCTRPHPIDQIVYVKVRPEELQSQLSQMESIWKEVFPGSGFDYWFLSEEFGRMYVAEQRMADLIQSFAILAILIASLGVFGLATFMAQRRLREVGIRKVLGATVGQIIVLLSRPFAGMILIAAILAIPFSWWLMTQWLQAFAYAIALSAVVFVGALLLVAGLTALSIGYETFKAATLNPVRHLRDE